MSEQPPVSDESAAPATIRGPAIQKSSTAENGTGILVSFALLIAVLSVIYLMGLRAPDTNPKDNAIAKAASDVSAAASKVGSAAKDAAKKVDPN